MLFLHPVGGGDPAGYVVFLDEGRSYFVSERGGGPTVPAEVVEYETAIAELDHGFESPQIVTRLS